MATVIGESGAWREIAEDLRLRGIELQRPNDIEPLLSHLRATYQPSVDRIKRKSAQRISGVDGSIATLRAEKGIWRSFVNWFRIQDCKRTIARLQMEERRSIDVLSGNIQRIEALQGSGELAGAIAELDVIEHLAHLPAGHTVLNDVRLIADRHIRFNGIPLQSAQIDHIVLSPAGVFIIETKFWSLNFVESGRYHNPFDQIQRSAYMCYDQLRRRFGKIRVRSVIAHAGHLPPAPSNSHVKVLKITELVGYLSWFKKQELSIDQLVQVCHYLEGFVHKTETPTRLWWGAIPFRQAHNPIMLTLAPQESTQPMLPPQQNGLQDDIRRLQMNHHFGDSGRDRPVSSLPAGSQGCGSHL